MAEKPPPPKRRLGEILLDAGLLQPSQLQAALAEQRKWGGRLGRTLVEMGLVKEDSMLVCLAQQLGLPTVDLDRAQLSPAVVRGLGLEFAERYGVFPVRVDPTKRTLAVATSDPTDLELEKQLAFHTGMKMSFVLSSSSAIERAIRRYYYGERTEPSATAVPQELGLSEAVFTPSALHRASSVDPISDPLHTAMRKIRQLEERLAKQATEHRALLEVLWERRLLGRDEYLVRVRKLNEQPAPE